MALDRARTGQLGEEATCNLLRERGFELHAVNWRVGHYELDIVAEREGCLHIVEVKTRHAGSLTPPEAAATPAKFRALKRAANLYLSLSGWRGDVQFDLSAVEMFPDGECRVELIEEAFESHW